MLPGVLKDIEDFELPSPQFHLFLQAGNTDILPSHFLQERLATPHYIHKFPLLFFADYLFLP